MPLDIAHSVCPHDCASACALDVELEAPDRVGRVHGSRTNSYTAGVVCAKVARYAERVHHPARLTQPLRRKGAKSASSTIADFEPIGWDDALDIVAEAFTGAVRTHGAETVWPYNYAGTMGKIQRDAIQGFRNALGYSRQHYTICSSIMLAGMTAGVGAQRGSDPREFGESDLIVIWGSNPVYTQVNLMTHISRARRERGARLVVIDPYRTATAEVADSHVQPRPGTDAALALAVMHVLFRDGYADRPYMARYTDDPEALERHVADRGPAWASAITGVPAAAIEELARSYGQAERAIIRLGYGFSRSRNGAAGLHAVSCLPAVRGAWKHRGGGLYGSISQTFDLDSRMLTGVEDPDVRLLDMSELGPVLTGDAEALKGGPPVTAMLVQSSNPAVVAPESGRVRAGMLKDDFFLCVHEQFLTDTARMADIVLPATTFLEHDDLYTSYGQTFLQIGPRILDPVGESRSNLEMVSALGRRLGADWPAMDRTAWQLIDDILLAAGYCGADELRERRSIDIAPAFEEAHFLNGFPQPGGRFRFRADWKALGPAHAALPELPDHVPSIDEADDKRPWRLVTAPSRNYLNSSFTETETSVVRESRPEIMLGPADCEAIGVVAGDRVRIGNARGSLVVHVRPFDGVKPGVAIVESIWPNDAFEEGIGINLLTSSEPGAPNGGAVFHDTAIWIRPA